MDIRACGPEDFAAIGEIINAAAQKYRGVIPPDRWTEPYMSPEHLQHEIAEGVVFWGCYDGDLLVGAMGLQDVRDVTLIRHAYVRPATQRAGIGGTLLARLRQLTPKPVLVGTWRAAQWAIDFYQRHGFKLVGADDKDRLLRKYWTISDRQIEESVVLADERWLTLSGDGTRD